MSRNTMNKSRPKKGLGRGLGSLLGEPKEEVVEIELPNEEFQAAKDPALRQGFVEDAKGSAQTVQKNSSPAPQIPDTARIWAVAIDKVVRNKKQPRKTFEPQALAELTASIKEKGVLQPIVARKLEEGRFEIIAGERRWRASQAAGLDEVPVILKETDEQNALELALIENIQRENLNPIEEAQAYYHLIKEYGLTQQKLAEKIGKDRVTIANLLRLLNLSPEVRKMLAANEISMGQAKVLLGVTEPKDQKNLALQVKNLKLSVRATEKLVQKFNSNKEDALDDLTIGNLDVSKKLVKGLSTELQKLLGTKVSISYTNGKGKVSIHYYSDDELNDLVDKVRSRWKN